MRYANMVTRYTHMGLPATPKPKNESELLQVRTSDLTLNSYSSLISYSYFLYSYSYINQPVRSTMVYRGSTQKIYYILLQIYYTLLRFVTVCYTRLFT
jgi:hypothetical protein